MMGPSDSERISMTRLAVLIQYTRVTDRQTDGIGVAYTRYSIYAVARKNTSTTATFVAVVDRERAFHFRSPGVATC